MATEVAPFTMRRSRRRSASPAPSDRPRQIRPPLRKSLGQHHLRSGAICRPLVEFLRPSGRLVVEVGPGGGVLTRELLAAGARVLALEIDPEWAGVLRERIPDPALEIRVGDALDVDWGSFPAGTSVAGNLPYNVGTAIVERVLRAHPPIERAAFLLQREVVDRMTAEPGDDAYGALSSLVKLRAEARRLGVVRPGAFVPPPKVESAFVGLHLRPLPPQLSAARARIFEDWIREAFGQRRKTLVNALGARFSRADVTAALESVRRPATTRAEELPLSELLLLFERLVAPGPEADRPPTARPREAAGARSGGTISTSEQHEES